MTKEEAMYLLNNLRSVAEGKEDEAIDMAVEALQVDLVKCGECKYQDCCSELNDKIEADDYCSCGERRSDG